MKNKRKILIFSIFVIIVLVIIILNFFYKNNYKVAEFGNTNIKSAKSIEEYILNISSYEADISLEVRSNKNTNKYRLKQQYESSNVFKQEVLEPENIQGLITIYDGKNLKIENTKLGLNQIYENYQYVSENSLCLYNFIEDYKKSDTSKYEENEDNIVMQVKLEQSENKYCVYKKLYIDKNTVKPIKMEIEDINQKVLVYILYNEIKINSINKGEILALK